MKTIFILIVAQIYFTNLMIAQYWEELNTPDTADIKCVLLDQSGTIFIGTSDNTVKGGIYRSYDNGVNWLFSDLSDYWITVFSILSIDSQKIYVGTSGPDTSIYMSPNDGFDWYGIYSGGGLTLFESQNNSIYSSSWGKIYKSDDIGENWSLVLSISESISINDFTETSNGYLFAVIWDFVNYTENGVFRSTDNGETWEFIDIANDGFTSIAVNSADEIFATSYFEGIFISSDYGETWIQKPGYHIEDLLIDDNDIIYAAADDYGVLHTSDSGETWEVISSGIVGNATKLAASPAGYLYCVAEHKLFRTIEPILENKQVEKQEFSIYPNPVTSFSVVTFHNPKNSCSFLYIYDITGHLISIRKTYSENFQISKSDFEQGVYIFKILTERQFQFSGKFIIN
jgi:hypothetical protein